MRSHRTAAQKIFFSDVFRCSRCGYRRKRVHPVVDANLAFVFSRYTRCIRCGSERIERLKKRDRIDSVSKNLVSRLLRLTGAPVNKCPSCRLQYYDWRRPAR